jgi:hypothetical protein
VLTCASLFAAVACSGGGTSARLEQPSCLSSNGTQGLCLVACNLGCSTAGCGITDIAQNQPIVLTFNQAIDPASVSPSTFQMRTASGQEPVGQYVTSGTTVAFLPELRVVGGASFFGFEANEVYTLTLPGGANQINALRSTDGETLRATLTCNLAVTRGVVDLDGEPPTARLLSPATTSDVDPATQVVLEFSEIIDATPFLTSTFGSEPVRVLVARAEAAGGSRRCNPTAKAVQVRGAWDVVNDPIRQVTTLMFRNQQPIPRGVCVVVDVSTATVDVSGRPSPGQRFEYVTIPGTTSALSIEERFADDLHFDADASGGSWVGGARPGLLGWDGLHGEFDPTVGKSVAPGVYEWSTDAQRVPGRRTLSGRDELVTDGVFRFSKFFLPGGLRVRFVGDHPARVYVSGVMEVDGEIDLSGSDPPVHDGNLPAGQPGGSAGPSGRPGGAGGDAGDGVAHQPRFDGQPGGDLELLASAASSGSGAGSAAAMHAAPAARVEQVAIARLLAGTGGRGSRQFPETGSNASVSAPFGGVFSVQIAAGGGGGGHRFPGASGRALTTWNGRREDLGSPALGGGALVSPAGTSTFERYLRGGSGGGGAGSHSFMSSSLQRVWRSGGGGGGGGGGLGLRIGRRFLLSGTGRIDATGGSTADCTGNNFAVPGGGGAGGAIVVQVGESPALEGRLDVGGGEGGTATGGFVAMTSKGGDGSPGVIRVEAPGPLPADAAAWVGPSNPPAALENVGELTERDAVTAVRSRWYQTGEIFPPTFDRYEIEAVVDGHAMTFSDDPARGVLAASGPLQLFVQAASEDLFGSVDLTTAGPWRRFVGPFAPPGELALSDDAGTVFRFALVFDTSIATDITVTRVTFVYRPL